MIRLNLDFDGTVHDYMHGWQDGTIYGNVTPGFFEWLQEASRKFEIHIHSSRSKTPHGRLAMRNWINAQYKLWLASRGVGGPAIPNLHFPEHKPAAFLSIDDRAIQFRGTWTDFSVEHMLAFQPWNKKESAT